MLLDVVSLPKRVDPMVGASIAKDGLGRSHILESSKYFNRTVNAYIIETIYAPGLETERRAHSYVDTLRVR